MLLFSAMISRHANADLAGGFLSGFALCNEVCGLMQLLDDFFRGVSLAFHVVCKVSCRTFQTFMTFGSTFWRRYLLVDFPTEKLDGVIGVPFRSRWS